MKSQESTQNSLYPKPYEHAVSNLVWMYSFVVSEINFHCIDRIYIYTRNILQHIQHSWKLPNQYGYSYMDEHEKYESEDL